MQKYGDEFTYLNENGNPAINKNILSEFRRISGNDVVWVQSERYWRKREPDDDPNLRAVR